MNSQHEPDYLEQAQHNPVVQGMELGCSCGCCLFIVGGCVMLLYFICVAIDHALH